MRHCRLSVLAAILAILAGPRPSAAQAEQTNNLWGHATELGLFAGSARMTSDTGLQIGTTLGWNVSRWLTVEGRADWFDRSVGNIAFGATMNALVNVIARRPVTPYVTAGFGLHHQSFDTTTGSIPEFYSRRMVADSGQLGPPPHSFTYPALAVGGGVDWLVTRNLTIRPEAGVRFVYGDGQTASLVSVGVRVGYVFENHPITPSVR